MTASHGRARRAGRAWLLSALAASGLHAVTLTGADSARACHISQHAKPRASAEAIAPHIPAAAPGEHAEGGPVAPALTPTSYVPKAAAPEILAPSPTSATKPVVVAAADLPATPTSMPKVETWNTDHPRGITPAVPSHFGSAATPVHCHLTPPKPGGPMTPLSPPAALQVLPTPEPSTALIGLVLAGFAWRRRRA